MIRLSLLDSSMARKKRNHTLIYGRTKKANHGSKPCRGLPKNQRVRFRLGLFK